jgi:hypothetical protein
MKSSRWFKGLDQKQIIRSLQLEVFKREGNAAIIGTDIAERYNLKLGDIMPMTPGLSAMNLELWWIFRR